MSRLRALLLVLRAADRDRRLVAHYCDDGVLRCRVRHQNAIERVFEDCADRERFVRGDAEM